MDDRGRVRSRAAPTVDTRHPEAGPHLRTVGTDEPRPAAVVHRLQGEVLDPQVGAGTVVRVQQIAQGLPDELTNAGTQHPFEPPVARMTRPSRSTTARPVGAHSNARSSKPTVGSL